MSNKIDCKQCKKYSNSYCKLKDHTPFTNGTINANVFGKVFVDGKYQDCNDFESIKEITIFDFIEE